MKENNSNNDIVLNITNEIWHINNTLRGYLSTEDFDVLLLILSAYKDGLIDETIDDYFNGINDILLDRISVSRKYSKVMGIYEPIIKVIHNRVIEQIIHILLRIDRELLNQYFPEIFDDLLYRFSLAIGKKSGEFILPKEISHFIMDLANLDSNATVYNPFAGLASFATFLNPDQRYYGQEMNHRTWALGSLRLMAKNLEHFEYTQEDSIANWKNFSEFDLIVSYPPFNVKLPKYYFDDRSNSFEEFVINKSAYQLPKNGQLICVLPLAFLFKGGREQKFREEIVNEGFINTIISLPPGLLKNTGIPFCIVVFKKSQSPDKYIRFVNANDFVIIKGPRDRRLSNIKLNEMIALNHENEFVKFVSIDEIHNAGYNLNVQRYFAKEFLGHVLVPEIAKYFKGSTVCKGEHGKFIRIRDLKDDVLDNLLEINGIENKELPLNANKKIEKSCLLLATRWKTLKPTYFKYEGEPIYISNDIAAVRIDENKVNINYLINELHSNYVKEQIDSYRITGVIPMIRRDDLFNIKIELPSIEEQNKKYYSVAKNYIDSFVKESEVDFKVSRIDIEDENSFLRHQIAGSLKSARGSFKFIKKILEEKLITRAPDLFELKADDKLESTLLTYLNNLERDLTSINKSVNRAGDKIDLMDLHIENFDLLLFIKEYIKGLEIRSKNFYAVNLDLDENAILEFGISAIHIEGDKDLLRKMLDNIIENVEKHAFSYGINNGNQNKIDIYLMYDLEDFTVQLDVSNTGKPLSANMSYESYVRKGSTSGPASGDGTGGWFINEVMKIHKGEFGFTDETGPGGIDSEFVTTIELTFPIIPAI
jgi:type I restriction enzyme M protein